MAKPVFFQVITRVDETHCKSRIIEAQRLSLAMQAADGMIVGARVADGPATEGTLDSVDPFEPVNRFDVMVCVQKAWNRIEFHVKRNIIADNAFAACKKVYQPKATPIGVRMLSGPVGPFTMDGKQL